MRVVSIARFGPFAVRVFVALLACAAATPLTGAADPWLGVPVLMYHKVDAIVPAHDAVGRDLTVEPAAFEAQLRYLRTHRIATLTAEDLTRELAAGRRPSHAVVLTFDDGYADSATTALPLLQKYGARGTFYVSSGFIGTPRHLSWSQIRTMRAAGMEVACHGTMHLDLSTLDRSGQMAEANGCLRRFVHYVPGSPPRTYAYPAGKYDAITLDIMKRIGIVAAFTERPGDVLGLARPYELPRRRIRHDDDLARFGELATP